MGRAPWNKSIKQFAILMPDRLISTCCFGVRKTLRACRWTVHQLIYNGLQGTIAGVFLLVPFTTTFTILLMAVSPLLFCLRV